MNFDYLALACQKLKITQDDILAQKLYLDRIVIVLVAGQKHVIPFEELNPLQPAPPKPETLPGPVEEKPRRRNK